MRPHLTIAALTALLCATLICSACSRPASTDEDESIPDTYDLTLLLQTADGLKVGDAVVENDRTAGRIARMRPHGDRIQADVRLESSYRIPGNADFVLERGKDGDRRIRIVQTPGANPRAIGAPVEVRIPPEALEDRLWVLK